MFDMLQTMLLRSQPLPFRLRIPDRPFGGSPSAPSEYYARVLALKHLDVLRLALYDGPPEIFTRLNPGMTPLPILTSLRIYNPCSLTETIFDGQFSARTLPNLQRLEADSLSFPTDDDPHQALQHLTCSLAFDKDYQLLFERFPNVVYVYLFNISLFTTLPPVSFPPSLRSIVLQADGSDELDVPRLMRHWAGGKIPQLVLLEARSLQDVLSLFLASHADRVELRLNSWNQELELRTLPTDGSESRTWTMTPSPLIEELFSRDTLQTRGCERLTSISVAIEQLGHLFSAQLDTPGLEDLEFRLVGSQKEPLLQADDGDFFIRAPRLQRVAFTMDASISEIREHRDEIRSALDVLHSSFRALIIYDADLLNSVTLTAPAESVLDISCPDFARFTKRYTVSQRV